MPSSVKMSRKNQIVVPREVREGLGLRPGDRLLVTLREDGVAELRRQTADLVSELEGLLEELPDGGDLWPEVRGE